MKSGVEKKALILLEAGALGGDTGRQLCLRAFKILEDKSGHTLSDEIDKFRLFHKTLQQQIKTTNKANRIRANRKQFEDTNPNYETLPSWRTMNQNARLADLEEAQITKEVNNQAAQLIPLAIAVLATEEIDIITYEATDTGTGGKIDDALISHINSLGDDTHYGCIVLGGGHGSPEVLSGLKKDFVQERVLQLHSKNISGDLICLGSCESATHAQYMQKLLQANGMVIGYLGDSTNNFALSTINYQLGITDEFIEVDLYDDNTEATAKASAIAMLYNNEITAFELSGNAINDTNTHYWNDSFSHLFIQALEAKALSSISPIQTPTIDTISVLGEHSDDPVTPMSALATENRTKFYVDGMKVDSLDSTLQINKVEIVKKMLVTTAGYDEARVIEELKDDNSWTDNEAQEYLEGLAEVIPTIKLLKFSDNTQDRLASVNTAIAHIIPPQNGMVYNPGLMTTPITPEIAERSLTVDAGKLKEELIALSSSIKSSIKLTGY